MTNQDLSTTAPYDKQSRPMRLLVHLDFAQSPTHPLELPNQGLLSVFVSEDIEHCQAKDKNCFKVIWQSFDAQALNMVPVKDSLSNENALANQIGESGAIERQIPQCYLLGADHPKLNEAKAICAFSTNGITYNEARARDECYSHLVAQTPFWRLLFQFHEKATDYLLLIHEDDLVGKRFEKAWLVRFKGNS